MDDEEHEYCLKASYPAQNMGCHFYPASVVVSKLEENEKSLEVSFSVKFTDKSQEFNLHLRDSDGGAAQLPWKKSYTVSAASYPLNEWVTVEIPLSAFMGTRGTWSDKDQKWYDLPCDFTWSRFESLYFDFDDFNGMKKGDIYIDDIVIKMK